MAKPADPRRVKRKKKRKPHVAPDLAIPSGRRRARRELVWGDHGFLRARFSNLHRVSPELWRSNQPSPRQVAEHARKRGIRTIINLRGESTKGYYLLEREACEANGIELVDFRVYSRDTPQVDAILGARELFERIAYPALMHCKSGADRAGLMAALYKLLRQGAPIGEAMAQLSLKYLHVRQGKTGMLDAFLEAYRDFAAHTPKPFLDWVCEDYDRDTVKSEFMARFESRLALDRILQRE
jgi:protein tyrosine/serine phosphatase